MRIVATASARPEALAANERQDVGAGVYHGEAHSEFLHATADSVCADGVNVKLHRLAAETDAHITRNGAQLAGQRGWRGGQGWHSPR